nr:HNH endonuclease [Halalkalibacter urbisdiaboli]
MGNGKQYSTLYEASTGNGASRSAHRNAANKEFYNQMANDAQFKKAMDDSFGYDVMGHMKSGKSALKNPSKDWAWHHPADTPGVVRLVPKNQHQSPLLQDVLHPGPNGQGGFGLFK